MTLGRVLGAIGRTLISAGVLILLFVAYQLVGTNLLEARAQNALGDEFEQALAEAGVVGTSSGEELVFRRTLSGVDLEYPQLFDRAEKFGPPPPPPDTGDAIARMRIPKIGMEKVVVEGVTVPDLKKGPGHYPGTPLPGQPGNVSIAGHRTTYGAPFFRLDELEPKSDTYEGDVILVTTTQGQFEYRVTESTIVSPSETSVLGDFGDNRLTLTTCHPRFSARQRLIIVAELVGEAAPATRSTALTDGGTVSADPDGVLIGEDVGEPTEPQTLEGGLGGERSAGLPAILWGLAAAAVWLQTWIIGRQWKKVPAYLVGTPVFLVVLFVFFENFSRLLPANF